MLTRCSFVFLLAAAAIAQDRQGGFGLVTDAAGKPWPNATVILSHRLHSALTDPRFRDRIEVKTDANGRFRARMLAGARYVAWARGETEAGGYRCSAIAADVVARRPILLKEGRRHRVHAVSVQLHESFGERKVEWLARTEIGGQVFASVLTPDAESVLHLPRWPTTTMWVEAWCEGWRVHRHYYQRKTDDAPAPVVVPQLREHVVQIVDESTGKPIPNVRALRHASGVAVGPDPRSDATGKFKGLYAAESANGRLLRSALFVDGYAEGTMTPGSWSPDTEKLVRAQRTLIPGKTVRGRLKLGEAALTGVPILLDSRVRSGKSSTWFGVSSRVFRTGAGGDFAVEGRLEKYPYRLTAALPPSVRRELSGAGRRAVPIAPFAIIASERVAEPKDVGVVDLAKMRQIEFTVLQPDGGQPGPVTLHVTPILDGTRNNPWQVVQLDTDRRGRVRMLVDDVAELAVFCLAPDGAARAVVEPKNDKVKLQLDARCVVKLRLVGENEQPLVGYSVSYGVPNRAEGIDARLSRLMNSTRMVNQFRGQRHGKTDKDGVVTLVTPMCGTAFDVAAYSPGRKQRANFPIVVDDEPRKPGKPIEPTTVKPEWR